MEDETRQPISGYVVNISSLKVSKGKRYFEFEIRNLTDQSRTVCFHRKNEYLFKVLPMTMITGIGNLLVRHFFLLKEGILKFENSSLIVGYSTVTEIINERSMYVMTNIMDAI